LEEICFRKDSQKIENNAKVFETIKLKLKIDAYNTIIMSSHWERNEPKRLCSLSRYKVAIQTRYHGGPLGMQ
jgi:hypothetical protein